MNKLRRDTDAATGAANAALEHVRHSEDVGDLANVLALPLERECGRTGNHLEAVHLRQSDDDLFRETVAEVLVVGVSAQIGKRQHRDRRRHVGAVGRQVVQRGPDVGHRLEPAVGILGEAALDDLLQRKWRLQRARIVAQHGAEDLGRGVARERPSARKQFIQHGAEAEYVRSGVERLGGRLLRGHVRWRSHHVASDRSRRAGISARELCDPEVEELGVRASALADDHNIRRLQIAVKDPALVRRVQGVGDLGRQPYRFVLCNPISKWFPLEILEDEVIGSDVVDLANVRMVNRGDGARFALKPVRIVSDQPLDRDRAIQASIVRLVDLAHTARADQRLNFVRAESGPRSQEHLVRRFYRARSLLTTGREGRARMELVSHCREETWSLRSGSQLDRHRRLTIRG